MNNETDSTYTGIGYIGIRISGNDANNGYIAPFEEAQRTTMTEQEQAKLNILCIYLEKMQKARHQETKDSILCQLVLSLLSYVPSAEIREKAKEILQEYNSEERLAQIDLETLEELHRLVHDMPIVKVTRLEDVTWLEQRDALLAKLAERAQ